jgi:hypothetical protein
MFQKVVLGCVCFLFALWTTKLLDAEMGVHVSLEVAHLAVRHLASLSRTLERLLFIVRKHVLPEPFDVSDHHSARDVTIRIELVQALQNLIRLLLDR